MCPRRRPHSAAKIRLNRESASMTEMLKVSVNGTRQRWAAETASRAATGSQTRSPQGSAMETATASATPSAAGWRCLTRLHCGSSSRRPSGGQSEIRSATGSGSAAVTQAGGTAETTMGCRSRCSNGTPPAMTSEKPTQNPTPMHSRKHWNLMTPEEIPKRSVSHRLRESR